MFVEITVGIMTAYKIKARMIRLCARRLVCLLCLVAANMIKETKIRLSKIEITIFKHIRYCRHNDYEPTSFIPTDVFYLSVDQCESHPRQDRIAKKQQDEERQHLM